MQIYTKKERQESIYEQRARLQCSMAIQEIMWSTQSRRRNTALRALVVLLGLSILVYLGWQVFWATDKCPRCEMTLISANFEPVELPEDTPYSYKYRLYEYFDGEHMDRMKKEENVEECIPLLFLHGSAGSYRQIRSLGTVMMDLHYKKKENPTTCFRYYTVDFNEEFSAFSGKLVRQQAQFTERVVNHILKTIHPKAGGITFVGHSFGGVVVKLLPPIPNLEVLNMALAVPLMSPRGGFDKGIDEIYAEFQETPKSSEVTHLSLYSESSDWTVPAKYSKTADGRITNMVIGNIPGVWSDPHHQALVWEKRTLLAIGQYALDFHQMEEPPSPSYPLMGGHQLEPLAKVRGKIIKDPLGQVYKRPDWIGVQKSRLIFVFEREHPTAEIEVRTTETLGMDLNVTCADAIAIEEDTVSLEGIHLPNFEVIPGFSWKLPTFVPGFINTRLTRTTTIAHCQSKYAVATLRHRHHHLQRLFYKSLSLIRYEMADFWHAMEKDVVADLHIQAIHRQVSKASAPITDGVWCLMFGRKYYLDNNITEIHIPVDVQSSIPIAFRLSGPIEAIQMTKDDGAIVYPELTVPILLDRHSKSIRILCFANSNEPITFTYEPLKSLLHALVHNFSEGILGVYLSAACLPLLGLLGSSIVPLFYFIKGGSPFLVVAPMAIIYCALLIVSTRMMRVSSYRRLVSCIPLLVKMTYDLRNVIFTLCTRGPLTYLWHPLDLLDPYTLFLAGIVLANFTLKLPPALPTAIKQATGIATIILIHLLNAERRLYTLPMLELFTRLSTLWLLDFMERKGRISIGDPTPVNK